MEGKKCDRCKEAVCIQTMQIYDSCKSKECVEDLRVYFSEEGQATVNAATSVKAREAELVWVFSDVEPVPFNKGFYTVDIKYFFKITVDVSGAESSGRLTGLAVYNKKIVLFGSEGSAKIFSSKFREGEFDVQNFRKTNLPEAIVEVVEPVVLSSKIVDKCKKCDCCCAIPACISNLFGCEFDTESSNKQMFVTLGLFTIVKLERNVQILIPAYDFCLPDKECVSASEDNPCELFQSIEFPVGEFFPPTKCDYDLSESTNSCRCGE